MVLRVVGSSPIFHPDTKSVLDNQMVMGTLFSYCQKSVRNCQKLMVEPERKNVSYPYREAKLVHYGYSPNRKWYIDFSAWDVVEGALKRKRITDFNSITGLVRRRAYAERLVGEINEMLTQGFHFNRKRAEELVRAKKASIPKPYYMLGEVMNAALRIKNAELSHSSVLSYRSDVRAFLEWAESAGLASLNSLLVGTDVGLRYCDYLTLEQQLVGKSINGRMSCLKSVVEVAFKRKLLSVNIFRTVAKRKEIVTKQNLAYTDDQIAIIKKKLLKVDPEVWYFCMFIFYTFMRPAEIRTLRVENVDFKKKKIYLAAENSKVKAERYVEISEGLRQVLESMEVNWKNRKEFLFKAPNGDAFKGKGKNYFAYKYRDVLDELHFEKHYTLYSWKHTGNVKAYQAGIGIHAIMRQNGHTNVETTMNYLKSLGLLENREFSEKFDGVVI